MTNWDDVYLPPGNLHTLEIMQHELARWAEAHPEEYEAAMLLGKRWRASLSTSGNGVASTDELKRTN